MDDKRDNRLRRDPLRMTTDELVETVRDYCALCGANLVEGQIFGAKAEMLTDRTKMKMSIVVVGIAEPKLVRKLIGGFSPDLLGKDLGFLVCSKQCQQELISLISSHELLFLRQIELPDEEIKRDNVIELKRRKAVKR